jgi:hypothetical protein
MSLLENEAVSGCSIGLQYWVTTACNAKDASYVITGLVSCRPNYRQGWIKKLHCRFSPQLPFELSSDNFISSKLIIQSTSKYTSDPVTPTSASVFRHPNPSSTIKFSQLSNHMERF